MNSHDRKVFNIMQTGELAHSALREETKAAITTIPWKDIYGMRNRIVHGGGMGYCKNDMQPLIDELQEAVTNI